MGVGKKSVCWRGASDAEQKAGLQDGGGRSRGKGRIRGSSENKLTEAPDHDGMGSRRIERKTWRTADSGEGKGRERE